MRLDFLLLADRAEAINGKLYMVGGGFDRVGVASLPGLANYDVALGFLVGYNETNQPHGFEIRMETEDNEVVTQDGKPVLVAGQVEVGRPAGMVTGQEQRVIIVVRGPFPAPAAGGFSWVPILDGQPFERTRFYVVEAAIPGQPVLGAGR
jgi:hypothetical protein